MTSRERVLKAMRREIPDKIPKDMSWGMTPIAQGVFEEQTGSTKTPEDYFGVDVRLMDFDIPASDLNTYAKYYGDIVENPRFSINAYGVGEMLSEKTEFHFTQMISPLKNAQTLNEFVDYKLPDVMDKKCFEHLYQEIGDVHNRGIAAIGPTDLTIFELAWAIRGYEEFMIDMLINPEFAECLLDRILEMRIAMAKKFVEMGIDVVTGGDDVACQRGMLMKRETFCELLKPRYDKLISEVKGMGENTLFFFH
ncbi:MAG: uroporphyrinogen decarboxylase family protein, partial [Christensenella sp.]